MKTRMTQAGAIAVLATLVATLMVLTRNVEDVDQTATDVIAQVHDVPTDRVPDETPQLEMGESDIRVAEGSAPRDWLQRLAESEDDFALAEELAGPAVRGDARAQYVLGRLLLECEIHRRILAPYKEGTIAERAERHLTTRPHDFEREREAFRRQVARCAPLFSEQPLAGYGLPDEAHGYNYWLDRALESGDPLQLMDRAIRSAAERGSTDSRSKDPDFREQLISDARRVAFAGDPAALFALGGVFSHPSVVTEPNHGYAWQVAACELGHDCSKANPAIGFGCAEDGTCVAGETYLDVMQRDLGAAKYAAIYASAQDIQYKIRTQDWNGLQQYLQVKE